MFVRNFIATAVLAALVPAAVSAITYTGNRNVGTGTAAISITTDDTLGVLTAANIVDWTITVSDPLGTFTLTGPLSGGNSQLGYTGNQFSATASGLFWDFDNPTSYGALFQTPFVGSGSQLYCLQSNGCYDFSGSGEGILTTTNFSDVTSTLQTGNQLIASAVPEPAAWTLLIGGFAFTGVAMRRRQLATA